MPPHLSSELCFAKRSATAASFFAVHWSKHFAMQNGLLSKFCYAKPPIQNFASQSGLRPPHHGHDFRKRKLPLATAPSCAVSRSKHFATQNGLRPPRFLRGAYFAVHKRQRSSLFLTAPFFFGVHTLRFIVQNFASQSGYATTSIFAVHKRLDLNFEQPYCQYFAILRVSSLASKTMRLVKPQNDFVNRPLAKIKLFSTLLPGIYPEAQFRLSV